MRAVLATVLFFAFVSVACGQQRQEGALMQVSERFSGILSELDQEPVPYSGPFPPRRYYDFWSLETIASKISQEYTDDEFNILPELYADSRTRGVRELAMFVIAKVNNDRSRKWLRHQLISDPGNVDPYVFVALSFVPQDQAKELLAEWLIGLGQVGDPRRFAEGFDLVTIMGDSNTLNLLKELQEDLRHRDGNISLDKLKTKVSSAIERLKSLESISEGDRSRYRKNAARFWQSMQHAFADRAGNHIFYVIPTALSMHKLTIDAQFLSRQLFADALFKDYPEAPRLAMAILAKQHPREAVRDLVRIVKERPYDAKFALGLLAHSSASESIRALESLIIPNSDYNNNIIYLLVNHGDSKSIEVLAMLAEDKSYSPEDRERFLKSSVFIRQRLAG